MNHLANVHSSDNNTPASVLVIIAPCLYCSRDSYLEPFIYFHWLSSLATFPWCLFLLSFVLGLFFSSFSSYKCANGTPFKLAISSLWVRFCMMQQCTLHCIAHCLPIICIFVLRTKKVTICLVIGQLWRKFAFELSVEKPLESLVAKYREGQIQITLDHTQDFHPGDRLYILLLCEVKSLWLYFGSIYCFSIKSQFG